MKVVIIGVGSTAMIVADIISASYNFSLSGFVGTSEEKEKLRRSNVYGDLPFLGDHSILAKLRKENEISGFIAAIGDNFIREKVFYEALQTGLIPVNAVSLKAIINPEVSLGKGIVISPGVVLSHGVSLEDNIILDPSVVVDVNSTIGAHCYLYPGVVVCGGCTLEKNVTLGAGAIVEPGVRIGKNQRVPAGAVVCNDLERLYRED